jgi:hypothetical protein
VGTPYWLDLDLSTLGGATTGELNPNCTAMEFESRCAISHLFSHSSWSSEAAPTPRTMIVLWLGQSNMNEFADASYTPAHASSQFQLLYGDGTLRDFVEPIIAQCSLHRTSVHGSDSSATTSSTPESPTTSSTASLPNQGNLHHLSASTASITPSSQPLAFA